MRFYPACCIVLIAFLLGCGRGPELGQVEGTVRLAGEPIEKVTVTFHAEDGSTSYGITDLDGKFELALSGRKGAVVGPNRVVIESYRIDVDANGDPVEHREKIPAKYNVDSELKREVQAGKQRFDFDL